MSVPVTNVICVVNDQDGAPVPGAKIEATLTGIDVFEGYVLPHKTSGVTDSSGSVTLALWPNQLGATESAYAFKIIAYGKIQRIAAVVPYPGTDVYLHEIAALPPFPGKLDGQVAIDAAQDAQVAAELARDQAASQAAASAASASASAGSAATAAGHVTTAAGHVTAAATQATNAANSATAAAGSATAAAGSATAAAGSATAAATSAGNAAASQAAAAALLSSFLPLAGGTLTGPVAVPAGASGSQAPRASEVGGLAVTQKAVGNVSQSGGNPTGSIMSATSWATQHHSIKFANGVMICWGSDAFSVTTGVASGAIYASTDQSFTFADTFASPPQVILGCMDATGAPVWAACSTVSSSGLTNAFLMSPSPTATGKFTYVAVGRWY